MDGHHLFVHEVFDHTHLIAFGSLILLAKHDDLTFVGSLFHHAPVNQTIIDAADDTHLDQDRNPFSDLNCASVKGKSSIKKFSHVPLGNIKAVVASRPISTNFT